MKDLVNYCKENNCRLEFVCDGDFIQILVCKNDRNRTWLCNLQKDTADLYYKLIREAKTEINLKAICGRSHKKRRELIKNSCCDMNSYKGE